MEFEDEQEMTKFAALNDNTETIIAKVPYDVDQNILYKIQVNITTNAD